MPSSTSMLLNNPLAVKIPQSKSGSLWDSNSMEGIRKQGLTDEKAAVKEAAKQFEAFFMNMMLKSMRQAGEAIGGDSLFSSKQEKMFIGMLDEQMATNLSESGSLGIADLMARDILGENDRPPNVDPRFTKMLLVNGKSIGVDEDKAKQNIIPTRVETQADSVKKATSLTGKNLPFEINPPQTVDKNLPAEKKSLFETAADFINDLMPSATKIAKRIGVDPKMLLAQAALETGWGKHIVHDGSGKPSNNLFGIKTAGNWVGDSVKVDTLEVEKGEFVKKKEDFRMYENFEKSFSDYADFLESNPRYQSALQVASDAKSFINSLQSAGYATDPNYADKIMNIFNQNISKHFGLGK